MNLVVDINCLVPDLRELANRMLANELCHSSSNKYVSDEEVNTYIVLIEVKLNDMIGTNPIVLGSRVLDDYTASIMNRQRVELAGYFIDKMELLPFNLSRVVAMMCSQSLGEGYLHILEDSLDF